MSQADETNFEFGLGGLASPCGVTPVDPPAHVYQATAVAVGYSPPGTLLAVTVSTVGNVTTFTLPAVAGQSGGGGGLALATVILPGFTFPSVVPNTGYSVMFSWNPGTQGYFNPCVLRGQVPNNRGAHFNVDEAMSDTTHQSWSVTVPPASGGGYTPAPMLITGAVLYGNWIPAAGVVPTAPGVYTIAGNWTIGAI